MDDIEEMMGEDLTGSELSEEARAEINEQSIAIYEDAVHSALEDVQRLFPDIFEEISAQLPEMRRKAAEQLEELAQEFPEETGLLLPKKGKPTLH